MGNHTTANIGKRVMVVFKDRSRLVDKLVGLRSKYYEFEETGRVPRETVKAILIRW